MKEKINRRRKIMNTKFEIRVYPNTAVEQEALKNLGFSQDWDHEPIKGLKKIII